jgi:hypothetical protein
MDRPHYNWRHFSIVISCVVVLTVVICLVLR